MMEGAAPEYESIYLDLYKMLTMVGQREKQRSRESERVSFGAFRLVVGIRISSTHFPVFFLFCLCRCLLLLPMGNCCSDNLGGQQAVGGGNGGAAKEGGSDAIVAVDYFLKSRGAYGLYSQIEVLFRLFRAFCFCFCADFDFAIKVFVSVVMRMVPKESLCTSFTAGGDVWGGTNVNFVEILENDLAKFGMIDPLKVIRTALVDAARVLAVLTTEAAVVQHFNY
ncbi:hypothetical protein ACLOJK_019466 [Asimina triloba]